MSFETFTSALNVAEFPFVSDFFQRSITIPGLDVPPRVPKTDLGTFESKNPELIQHYYAQNVMPTSEGLMSVGFTQIVAGIPGAVDFDEVIVLRDIDENVFLYSPAAGKNYIFRADAGLWISKNPFIANPAVPLVTRAFVNGRTFVCFQHQGIFEYDTAADTFLPVVVTGLTVNGAPATVADIDGISASNNYLLAWSNIQILWSSLINPLDFTPDIFTGAGFATPQDVRGPIRNIVPISGGYIAYTTRNAVAALYTNNARAPWAFKEISNTGGIVHPEEISLEATLGFHYAFTNTGLQKITANASEPVSGAASDFLAGRIYESFDLSTLTFTLERLAAPLKIKIAYVSGRYLMISYGKQTSPQIYTHALAFDTILKRWGKLRIDHVDCFTYPYPNLLGQLSEVPSKQSMAFLAVDGTVNLCVLDYRSFQDQGVLLLGKFQLVRQKMITFQAVELESLVQSFPPNIYLQLSIDGRNNGAPVLLPTVKDSGNYKKYGAPTYSGSGASPARTGKSFSVLITGTFELSSVIHTLTRHGNR